MAASWRRIFGARWFVRLLVFAWLLMLSLPGGALLEDLTQLQIAARLSPVLQSSVALCCAALVALAILARATVIRCLGCGVVLAGFAALTNALAAGRSLTSQLTWIVAGAAVGMLAGHWLTNRAAPSAPTKDTPDPETNRPGRLPIRLGRLLAFSGVITAVLGFVFALDLNRAATQARIAEAVSDSAGRAMYDDHYIPTLVFHWLELFPEYHHELSRKSLSRLELGCDVNDERLAEMVGLGLADLPDLSGLSLQKSRVTDQGLEAVARLDRLTHLAVSRETTDAGLIPLQRLAALRWLDLGNAQTTGEWLRQFAPMPQITLLNLRFNKIADEDMASLKKFPRLTSLDVSGTGIGDEGLAQLEGFSNLRVLFLIRTRVSDAGLVHLKSIPNLRWVFVAETAVTQRGAYDFWKARPEVRVEPFSSGPSPEQQASRGR